MGSNPSTAQAEQRFLDAIQEIKPGKEESIDNVLTLAYNVPDFNTCFPFYDVQRVYNKHPAEVKNLTLKTIDYLSTQNDPKMIRTCISLLSRLIPGLALSVVDPKELDWLFVGENSAIFNLFTSLKLLLFAPLILNQEDARDQLIWYWGLQLQYKVETARTDAMFLFFFAHNGPFFFPNNPEIQEQNKKLACLDTNVAKYLINSIVESIYAHNIRFLTMAIPYCCIAMINDLNFRNAYKGTQLMEGLSDLVYVSIDDINALFHYTYTITNIEIDLIVLSFICLLVDRKIEYNVQKMAASIVRFLQLANEATPKIIGANHRLALSILSLISSSKTNGKKLEEEMEIFFFGTQYKFNTNSSSIAILEAVTNTVLMMKSEALSILPLVISVIHNISPFIVDCCYAPTLFAKLFEAALNQFKDKNNFFDALIISVERYVNGDVIKKEDEDGKLRRSELNKAISNLSVFNNGENEELKQKILTAIQSDKIQNDYPLVIDQIDSHLSWAKCVVFELFEKRNQISLERIRKKGKTSKAKK